MFNLSQAGEKCKFAAAPKTPPQRTVAMELLNQTHKEVPTGWVLVLADLVARARRQRPRREPLLLTGPRHLGHGQSGGLA